MRRNETPIPAKRPCPPQPERLFSPLPCPFCSPRRSPCQRSRHSICINASRLMIRVPCCWKAAIPLEGLTLAIVFPLSLPTLHLSFGPVADTLSGSHVINPCSLASRI